MENSGDIKIFNPAEGIAREITLRVLIQHRDASTQARQGLLMGQTDAPEEEKKLNKIKGLYKMISAQKEMITISRPIIHHHCHRIWLKKHQDEMSQEKEPFEEEENEYSEIIHVKELLDEAERDMVTAEQTQSQKDDYLIRKVTPVGIKFVLSDKYYDLLKLLEDWYEKISYLMLKYKIISSGIEEDELLTYKEQEQEAIRRVVEA